MAGTSIALGKAARRRFACCKTLCPAEGEPPQLEPSPVIILVDGNTNEYRTQFFDLNTRRFALPPNWTVRSAGSAIDRANNIYYAGTQTDPWTFVKTDLLTGVQTDIPVIAWDGGVPNKKNSLTFDPDTGLIVASDSSYLYRIDPATGVEERWIGPFDVSLSGGSLCRDADGNYYNNGSGDIFLLDLATPTKNLFYTFKGWAGGGINGMDVYDGKIYVTFNLGNPGNRRGVYFSYDLATGEEEFLMPWAEQGNTLTVWLKPADTRMDQGLAVDDGPYVHPLGQTNYRTLTEGAPSLLDNDGGVDPKEAWIASPPAKGDLIVLPDGHFEYTRSDDLEATIEFDYYSIDANDQYSVATATIQVQGYRPHFLLGRAGTGNNIQLYNLATETFSDSGWVSPVDGVTLLDNVYGSAERGGQRSAYVVQRRVNTQDDSIYKIDLDTQVITRWDALNWGIADRRRQTLLYQFPRYYATDSTGRLKYVAGESGGDWEFQFGGVSEIVFRRFYNVNPQAMYREGSSHWLVTIVPLVVGEGDNRTIYRLPAPSNLANDGFLRDTELYQFQNMDPAGRITGLAKDAEGYIYASVTMGGAANGPTILRYDPVYGTEEEFLPLPWEVETISYIELA